MGFYTGQDGYLESGGRRIGKVQSWSLDSSVALREVSKVGDCDKTYAPGIRTTTGTALIWYYDDEPASLLGRVMRTGEPLGNTSFKLGWGAKSVSFNGVVTRASINCSSGGIMQASIEFQASGAFTGVAL